MPSEPHWLSDLPIHQGHRFFVCLLDQLELIRVATVVRVVHLRFLTIGSGNFPDGHRWGQAKGSKALGQGLGIGSFFVGSVVKVYRLPRWPPRASPCFSNSARSSVKVCTS